MSALERRPRDPVGGEEPRPSIHLEGGAVVDAVVVDRGDQAALDVRPMRAQELEHHHVNRDPVVLHRGVGGHETAPHERAR
jgi:hypothetical protein